MTINSVVNTIQTGMWCFNKSPKTRGGRRKRVRGEDICCDERHFVFVKLASLSHLKQTKYLDDSWEVGNLKFSYSTI